MNYLWLYLNARRSRRISFIRAGLLFAALLSVGEDVALSSINIYPVSSPLYISSLHLRIFETVVEATSYNSNQYICSSSKSLDTDFPINYSALFKYVQISSLVSTQLINIKMNSIQ